MWIPTTKKILMWMTMCDSFWPESSLWKKKFRCIFFVNIHSLFFDYNSFIYYSSFIIIMNVTIWIMMTKENRNSNKFVGHIDFVSCHHHGNIFFCRKVGIYSITTTTTKTTNVLSRNFLQKNGHILLVGKKIYNSFLHARLLLNFFSVHLGIFSS